MQNNKTKKSKHIFNLALIALAAVIVVSSSAMAGCGEESEETKNTSATKVITETQIQTEIVPVTKNADENKSDSNTSSKSSSDTGNNSAGGSQSNQSGSSVKTNDGNNTVKSNTNSGTNNTGSENDDKSYSDSVIKENNSNNKNHNNDDKSLTVNGKKYYVGDIIKCKITLNTPDVIENFQGSVHYNSKQLKVTKARLSKPAKGGSLINSKTPGLVNYNGSEIDEGYDFRGGNDFAEIIFEVIGTGKSTPSVTWNVATQLSENNNGIKYVINDKPANGMSYSVQYTG